MGIGGWGLPPIMRQPQSYPPIPISGPNPQSPFLYNFGAKIFSGKKIYFFLNGYNKKSRGGLWVGIELM